MKVTFKYDRRKPSIEVEYKGIKESFCYSDYGKSYGAIWPLLIFNLLLKAYKSEHEMRDLFDERPIYINITKSVTDCVAGKALPNDADIESRCVKYINGTVLKGTPLRIEAHRTKKGYYTLEIDTESLPLEWRAETGDFRTMGMYGLKDASAVKEWSCEEGLILGEKLRSQGDVLKRSLRKTKFPDVLKGEKIEPGIVWDIDKILNVTDDIEKYMKIDFGLLPRVKAAGETFDNLSTFVLERFIKTNDNYKSYSILEGDAGAGKSYSLYHTARNLSLFKHIPIIVPLNEVFSEEGAGSLLTHICKYMEGHSNKSPIERIRNLCRKADEKQKVFIMIDGFDEIFPGYYSQLGYEIGEILNIGNPNLYIILAGRKASHFIENSSMQNKSCLNIECGEVVLRTTADEEEELVDILNNYPETRTPLFISYYRETMAKYEIIRKDSDRAKSLELYGRDIDFKNIHNYYDLFKANTSMLCAHARANTLSDGLFSSIIPELAFNLYEDEKRVFSKEYFDGINHEYFEDAELDEKINAILSSGVVRKNISDSNYIFSHYEYMQFLAAVHAAKIIDSSGNEGYSILQEAVERTTYHYTSDNESIERVNKMRFIPFGYYLIKELLHGEKENRDEASFVKDFNPLLFRLGANVVYEDKDLWDELNQYPRIFLKDKKNVIINGAKATIESDEWELVDAISMMSYTLTTKTEKKGKEKVETLNTIFDDLIDCAGVIMYDTYNAMGRGELYYETLMLSQNKWNAEFAERSMLELIGLIRSSSNVDFSTWKYPVDLVGRIYGNIGAAFLEKSRVIRSSKELQDKVSPDILLKKAEHFHSLAKEYREALTERFAKLRSEVSLTRSNIALGTDMFYHGLYEEDSDKAIEYLENAVNTYHYAALKIQGIDPKLANFYSYDMDLPIERTIEAQEKPRHGAEVLVIWPRIAGCYHLCYTKLKVKQENNSDAIVKEYISKQYIALRAAYLFLIEACVSDFKKKELDKTKLEIYRAAINELYSDKAKKYLESFSDPLCDNKEEILQLLIGISNLYMSLHPHKKITVLLEKDRLIINEE